MKKLTQILAGCLVSFLVASTAQAAGKLNIYNWFDYMPQELLDKFSKAYDVEITMDTYDSNESLLARLKAGVTGYDVAVPGDYMVAILIKEGMLEKVEPNKMANFKHMDPNWVDVYWDPGRNYSIPYQWGTTYFRVDFSARARMPKPFQIWPAAASPETSTSLAPSELKLSQCALADTNSSFSSLSCSGLSLQRG